MGEALLAVDPESTHDAVTLFKEEEARRIKREGGDFTPENPVPADEAVSQITQEETKEEEAKTEETAPAEEDTPVEEAPEATPVQPEIVPTPESGGGSAPEVPTEPVVPVVPTEVPTTPSEPAVVPPTTEADLSSQNTVIEPIPERPEVIPEPVEPPSPIEVLIESVSNGLTE